MGCLVKMLDVSRGEFERPPIEISGFKMLDVISAIILLADKRKRLL